MRLIFAGTPENAAQTLRALSKSNHEIVAVLTREDAEIGRKRVLTESAVAIEAKRLGIEIIKANKIDQNIRAKIEELKADLGVVVAYGLLFKSDFLNLPKHGWLNIHYSLLPKWRGAAPVQRAILNGDTETGVTLFRLDEGMDTGAILCAVPTLIEPGENSADLLARLTQLGISALDETLARIDAGISASQEQPSEGASIAKKLTREEARINWSLSAAKVDLIVRAFNPEPMAWTIAPTSSGEFTYRIIQARPASLQNLNPGEVTFADGHVYVGCGEQSSLEIIQLQPAGKQIMSAQDWARGLQTQVKFD